jgi:mono/diheme cytochrome c family protein
MITRNLWIGSLALLLLGFWCIAQQNEGKKVEIKKVPITYVDPTSGKQMYANYCAACHGMDAKGNGPAAPALKYTLPDLTTLAKQNNGKYPGEHISQVIKGDANAPAHGSKEMPVWGPAFASLQPYGDSSIDVQRRIVSLNDYIESMQEK